MVQPLPAFVFRPEPGIGGRARDIAPRPVAGVVQREKRQRGCAAGRLVGIQPAHQAVLHLTGVAVVMTGHQLADGSGRSGLFQQLAVAVVERRHRAMGHGQQILPSLPGQFFQKLAVARGEHPRRAVEQHHMVVLPGSRQNRGTAFFPGRIAHLRIAGSQQERYFRLFQLQPDPHSGGLGSGSGQVPRPDDQVYFLRLRFRQRPIQHGFLYGIRRVRQMKIGQNRYSKHLTSPQNCRCLPGNPRTRPPTSEAAGCRAGTGSGTPPPCPAPTRSRTPRRVRGRPVR